MRKNIKSLGDTIIKIEIEEKCCYCYDLQLTGTVRRLLYADVTTAVMSQVYKCNRLEVRWLYKDVSSAKLPCIRASEGKKVCECSSITVIVVR